MPIVTFLSALACRAQARRFSTPLEFAFVTAGSSEPDAGKLDLAPGGDGDGAQAATPPLPV